MSLSRVRPRRILWGLGLVVLLCLLAFCWQAWRAGQALADASDQARSLQSELVQGHLGGARQTVDALTDATGRAADHTDGPLWALAAHLPLVGSNVQAVRTTSSVLHQLTDRSLPILLQLARAGDHGDLQPRHGQMDLAAIKGWVPRLRRAAQAADAPARRLAAVDTSGLFLPVAGFVGPVQGMVDHARAALDSAADAFTVMPSMMGADGPRTYLLLIQNNAEIRATGGMPGSWAILHADHGHLSMGRQGSAVDLGQTTRPVLPLRPAERKLFGPTMGTDLRDVNFTPDFPRAARLAAGIVQQRLGVHLDGVFSVDPLALGYVLAGLGPVKVNPQVTLTSVNAANALLHNTYRYLPTQQQQDDFNEASARAVFDAMVAGRGSEVSMVSGLVRAVREHRLLAWSRDPQVARVISGNRLSGELTGDDGRTPHVGVYLDDAAGSKMEYYLRQSAQVVTSHCRRGTQRLTVSVTLRSTAPKDISTYPVSVTGFGTVVPRGTIYVNAWLYAPFHGRITSLRVDGGPVTVGGGTQKGRQVATYAVKLPPGTRHTLTARMTTGTGQTGGPVLTTTPDVESRPDPVTGTSACS